MLTWLSNDGAGGGDAWEAAPGAAPETSRANSRRGRRQRPPPPHSTALEGAVGAGVVEAAADLFCRALLTVTAAIEPRVSLISQNLNIQSH